MQRGSSIKYFLMNYWFTLTSIFSFWIRFRNWIRILLFMDWSTLIQLRISISLLIIWLLIMSIYNFRLRLMMESWRMVLMLLIFWRILGIIRKVDTLILEILIRIFRLIWEYFHREILIKLNLRWKSMEKMQSQTIKYSFFQFHSIL